MYCENYTVEDVLQQNLGFTPRSTAVPDDPFAGLLTLSADDEHTTCDQQKLRPSSVLS
jgi:hypothetical protein